MLNIQDAKIFKEQIQEDIDVLQARWGYADLNMCKPEYAFNYWVLSRIFSLDEEIILDNITEYNDKGIDCFVFFEDSKELFIIQNKYYSDSTAVISDDVAAFLQRPLSLLKANQYKKSETLQNIFNKIKDNPEYKITFRFFATTDNRGSDIEQLIKEFNSSDHGLSGLVSASFLGLSEIYELYYGKNYRENIPFKYSLGTINKGTFASLRDIYGMEGLYEAYYIVTPVVQIYKMIKAAEAIDYPIFEKNIREYLGDNLVNNGIVDTLRKEEERKNFIYYNNGITVICRKIKASHQDIQSGLRMLPLENPQIVNGCQTVSSIKKMLENLSENELQNDFKNVYVMLKALVIENPDEEENKQFYKNVVKYTNRQNAISEKAFSSNKDVFYRLKAEFRTRGFSLFVKPSDQNTFKTLSKVDKADLLQKANQFISDIDFYLTASNEVCIPLEKLLQVFLAFVKTGYFAFKKKNLLLQQGQDIFDQYTSQIHKFLTVDNMIKLYYFYKKAEAEQKESIDKRSPIPYYVIGFFGSLIGNLTEENIQKALNYVFSDKSIAKEAYKYLVAVSKNYRRTYEKTHSANGDGDYNLMIKRPIEDSSYQFAVESVNDIGDWKNVKYWVETK